MPRETGIEGWAQEEAMETWHSATLAAFLTLVSIATVTAAQQNTIAPQTSSLTVGLQTSKSVFRTGELVSLQITLTNETNRPVAILFAAGRQYRLQITDPKGRIVWTLARHISAGPSQFIVVGRKQTLVFEERWNQRTIEGVSAKPGDYMANGWFDGAVLPMMQSDRLGVSVSLAGIDRTGFTTALPRIPFVIGQ